MKYRNAALVACASVVLAFFGSANASDSAAAGSDEPGNTALRQDVLSDIQDARPDDHLPDAYLAQEHTDLCTLPDPQRQELLNAFDEPPGNETVLQYAERGVVQAQAKAGEVCGEQLEILGDGSLTQDEALDWARRAAASGEPSAASALGRCLHETLREQQTPSHDAAWDEVLYWYWQAARGMDVNGLMGLQLSSSEDLYPSPTEAEAGIRDYMWHRVHDLLLILQNASEESRAMLADYQGVAERHELTPEQVNEAETRVGEFLKDNQDALVNFRVFHGCPSPEWYGGDAFDYTALNQQLQHYGLQVQPAEDWQPWLLWER